MRISHEKKFVFLSKPRCASESIRKMLDPFSSVKSSNMNPYKHHVSAVELKKQFTEEGWDWDKYFKFISIRNPWDMLVSVYHYGKPNKEGLYFWNDPERKSGSSSASLMPFSKWINSNNFWYWSLERFIEDENGDSLVDKIIKVENLKDEMSEISKFLGLNLKDVIHINTSNHKKYHNYYDKQTADRVSELFEFEIEIGNYTY